MDEEIRKRQIAKLKTEISKMEEIFHSDFDRLAEKYDLPRRTVIAICARSGKFDDEAHARSRKIELESIEHEQRMELQPSRSGPDTQYGVLQPIANTGAGCFTWVVGLGLVFLVLMAFASLFQ